MGWLCIAGSDGHNPHSDNISACNDCHLRDPVQITRKESGTNLFLADIETLCLRCHRETTLSMSHPIGIKPTFPLPLDMYLDWKGEMTCTTCHYMHNNGNGVHGAGNDKYLRRNSKGRDFCLECHQQGFMSQKGLSHALATGAAHSKQFSEFDTGELLGASSSECLSCHDGSIASDGGTMSLNGPKLNSGVWEHQDQSYDGRGSSHPIGIDYNEAYRRNPQEITEIALLPRTILLPDGKVECVSCHNLYTREANLLSVTNFGSRLCLTCHKK